MYRGSIMEQGKADEVFAPPYHPYTGTLLSVVPIVDTSICETERPPDVAASPGHVITCHIPMAELQKMEPVIVQVKKDQPVAE